MKPYVKLAESDLPDGTRYSLHHHDGKFFLKYNGFDLMSTALTYSEQMLADLGCSRLLTDSPSRPAHPKVLIGGLGLGFTLKRTLELIGNPATVDVAELLPPLIEWNRTHLVEHNGPLLEDPRTNVIQDDLFNIVSAAEPESYDAILIDIDNTPDDLITSGNSRMYTPQFLKTLKSLIPKRAASPIGFPSVRLSSSKCSARSDSPSKNTPRRITRTPNDHDIVSWSRTTSSSQDGPCEEKERPCNARRFMRCLDACSSGWQRLKCSRAIDGPSSP